MSRVLAHANNTGDILLAYLVLMWVISAVDCCHLRLKYLKLLADLRGRLEFSPSHR